MKQTYLTPGPSQLYPTVPKHMRQALKDHIPSISHRSSQFQQIFQNATDNLRQLLHIPDTHHIFFLSSATEAMEVIIRDCVPSASLHFVNGAFSQRFHQTALALNKKSQSIEVDWGRGFSEELLKSYQLKAKNYQLFAFTHNETSTGVQLDLNLIYQLKQKHPHILTALDVVSSVPDVELNFNYLDAVFFSVQKGFGLPAGLGVLAVGAGLLSAQAVGLSPDSWAPTRGAPTYNPFHSLLSLYKYAQKSQTPETPNVLNIYLLGQVAQDMLDYGIDKIRQETTHKAQLLYDFFERHPNFKPFVFNPEHRSRTVVTVELLPSLDKKRQDGVTKNISKKIINQLAKQGFVIGSGYGPYKDTQIRIANFPSHKISQVKKLIKSF